MRRAMSKSGPFTKERVRTREGLFSALIFCSILFGSDILDDPELGLFYDSLEHWELSVKGEDDNYVCNKASYFTYIPKKLPSNAKQYWIGSKRWPSIVADRMLKFFKCWHHLTGMDVRSKQAGDEIDDEHKDQVVTDSDDESACSHFKPETPTKPKLFPIFGKLIGYLLTVDFVKAGVVEGPTIEEEGHAISIINKGLAKALKRLRLTGEDESNTRKVTTVETINVIATLHDFLDDHLTYREKELMHFGPMMEEHALCKFGVALRNGWI